MDRQTDDEARPAAAVMPVLGADRAAMALDRGPGDGEAEARMLAEILAVGTEAVEALEDRFARFGRHAGPFILDADDRVAADPGRADLDQAAGRREGDGIVDEIVDRAGKPRFVAHDHRASDARTAEGQPDLALAGPF